MYYVCILRVIVAIIASVVAELVVLGLATTNQNGKFVVERTNH